MPSVDSPEVLVARFLQANNFTEVRARSMTLDTFLAEAGLSQDAGATHPGALTLERVLDEKRVFDLTLHFEKASTVADGDEGWKQFRLVPIVLSSLENASNLLHVSISKAESSTADGTGLRSYIFATTADRRLNVLSTEAPFLLTDMESYDSPVLSCVVVRNRWLFSTSMSGQLVLRDLRTNTKKGHRRDHVKYAIQVVALPDDDGIWVATAGWDAKVFIYRIDWPEAGQDAISLDSPRATLTLQTNPESLVFVKQRAEAPPILVVSRRDSTFLYYYSLPALHQDLSTPSPASSTLQLEGKQNLTPHSTAWVAFSPSSLALCPIDPTLLAVATASVPHMKLIIVRMLLPSVDSSMIRDSVADNAPTRATQTEAARRRADDESSAIVSHTNAMAPQTAYSTPHVVWRPGGQGVWVNGDDGVIRGIEATTGKVVQKLEGGHDPGSKIRSLWCGMVETEEWVVSGGFDQRLIVWRPDTLADDDHVDAGSDG
ncbi:MAG: hypothetical protein M1825_000113 [Sarcosagium campestre]|nr:MAG: hypothetical protein M1825_000113 [Sarcosagium campestre]